MRPSVYIAACALLVATSLSLAPATAALSSDLVHNPSTSSNDTRGNLDSSGLSVGRIFDTSSHGDVISFSNSAPSLGSADSISGFSLGLPASGQNHGSIAKVFAATANATHGAESLQFATAPRAQAVGMQFELLSGAEATISLQSNASSFGSGLLAANPSQEPAVFAFYNFPQANNRIGLGEAFGLHPRDAAFAASLSASQQTQSVATGNALTSPLISSLSAQGPFWYSAYATATQGSSLNLSIPFRLAKIPVRVRLGEQSVSTVQTSSLATQILGPAFATSAAGNFKSVTGGVTLALPLLSRRATVSLDGWYETLARTDKTPFSLAPYASQSSAGIGSTTDAVIYSPTDVQQYVGAASVALPVTSHITVNGSFSAQVSGSVALDTLAQDLTQRKTAYGGGVGYKFPKANSSIDLFFNKNVYTDNNTPTFTENRQNLYFSVKF